MEYIGEHLFAGNLGRFFVILSFTAALLSAFSYIKFWDHADRPEWKKLARASFITHGLSVFGIVATLFYMMLNHYYEYHYVWSHTSNDLPFKYMFSSFWEGQEGSFLLWMFWHAVLGFFLMFSAKKWESGTMLTLVLVQAFLATMIMGVYLGDFKLGQSPFVLIRELPEYVGLPWTKEANYLNVIPAFADGEGLNPLLKNYWMTIHPPTLFLGFASTVIPFAFAIAGLLKNNHKEWVKPAIPWAFFSVGILGIGILMGGAWAYEALSFGGFWAWDPVENASLVPWLIMVGAAHVLLIQRNRGGSIHTAYILTLLAFILILYSTFLTRSGILGDSSVHSFVDLGLSGQLLVYLLSFVVIAFGLYFFRFGSIKSESKEDHLSSREFWMFIGSLVLLLSGLQITISTSMPVWDALFGPEGWIPIADGKLAPPTDAIAHYNRWQLPFAIVITLLIAFGQLLNYRNTAGAIFRKRILFSIGLSIVFTTITVIRMNWENPIYILLMFVSFWAIMSNLDFWLRIGKRAKTITGSSVAHVGFGLIMLGTLISQGKQHIISQNDKFIAEDFDVNENLVLDRGDTLNMAGYRVQWFDEYREGENVYFPLRFWEPGASEVSFILEPFVQENETMGQVVEPSTKHYLDKDIYTHLTYYDPRDSTERYSEWQREVEVNATRGMEELLYRKYMMRIDSVIIYRIDTLDRQINGAKFGVQVEITTMNNEQFTAIPTYELTPQGEVKLDAEIEELGLRFRFEQPNAAAEGITLKIWERASEVEDFIIIKSIVFPYINLLWLGCITMGIGSFIAVYTRVRQK
ncbi:cytochrome c biogenesis protein CcsA [Phaeocystidibacter luteus]|uniref:Cytochrome C biogenesis protein n=1 Tax=Phaeocystidibacter luteus TaxID=911197 RepID=A0A6N6RJ16_9FLAO|nr:cytochrome c biogenesis protein CcsA [Phaeocystidibacter luteus]KAB2805451.1 cytochrome C biogenesis protein [Phaeocystidibacter luteus]